MVVARQNGGLAQRAPRRRNSLVHAGIGQGKIVVERTTLPLSQYGYFNRFENAHNTPPSVRFGRALKGLANLDGDVESQTRLQSARCDGTRSPSQRGCCSLCFLDAPVAVFVAKTESPQRLVVRTSLITDRTRINAEIGNWTGAQCVLTLSAARHPALFVTRESRQVS